MLARNSNEHPAMQFSCYVTGTDTGAGKTHASIALLHGLQRLGRRAVGMKPVASGARENRHGWSNEDAVGLLQASAFQPDYALVNPVCLKDATAPEIAAAHEGRQFGLAELETAFSALRAQADDVVVEGVGGWCAPLSDRLMQADLVRALELPVVLVVGMRLGCINHALMTLAALQADGMRIAGWIANSVDPELEFADEYFACLHRRMPVPCLAQLAWRSPAALAQIDLGPLGKSNLR
jgi:dethiobiotin synthetase